MNSRKDQFEHGKQGKDIWFLTYKEKQLKILLTYFSYFSTKSLRQYFTKGTSVGVALIDYFFLDRAHIAVLRNARKVRAQCFRQI